MPTLAHALLVAFLFGAPAPANDDFDQATVIATLPFTETLDTSGATTASDDFDGCGEEVRTVWYALTLTEDIPIVVKTSESDFSTYVTVLTGSRGNLQRVTCSFSNAYFLGVAGETYYVMVDTTADSPPGMLRLVVAEYLEVGVDLQATGSIDPRTGTVSVSATLTCSKPSLVEVFGFVEQVVDGQFVVAPVHGQVPCEGIGYWLASGVAHDGAFAPGFAVLSVASRAYDAETDEFVHGLWSVPAGLGWGRVLGWGPDPDPPILDAPTAR